MKKELVIALIFAGVAYYLYRRSTYTSVEVEADSYSADVDYTDEVHKTNDVAEANTGIINKSGNTNRNQVNLVELSTGKPNTTGKQRSDRGAASIFKLTPITEMWQSRTLNTK